MALGRMTEAQFLETWSGAIDKGMSLRALSRHLNIDRRALQRRAERLRERGVEVPFFPKKQGRVDQANLHYDESATRDSLIETLQQLQSESPRRYITRNFFAHETGLADKTWNRFFGTFDEFRRQAGVQVSRAVHQLEKKIAKHVASDAYRAMNGQRHQWGEAYLRPAGTRFQTILAASDLHDTECDPFFLRVLIDTARRAQPNVVCFDGDIFDLPEFGKYTVDPRTWNASGRVRHVHKHILAPMREAVPNAQIDLIEGNHEYRLVRQLADTNPAMMALLSDLHGMDVADLFGLRDFQINYVAKSDLAAYRVTDIKREVARNWRIYFDCILAHHFPEGRRKGMPGFNGHHHKHVVWPASSPTYGPFEWHQLGCGHVRDASYCDGENWHNGFLLIHVDTHTRATLFEYVPVRDHAMVGGLLYQRKKGEHTGAHA